MACATWRQCPAHAHGICLVHIIHAYIYGTHGIHICTWHMAVMPNMLGDQQCTKSSLFWSSMSSLFDRVKHDNLVASPLCMACGCISLEERLSDCLYIYMTVLCRHGSWTGKDAAHNPDCSSSLAGCAVHYAARLEAQESGALCQLCSVSLLQGPFNIQNHVQCMLHALKVPESVLAQHC